MKEKKDTNEQRPGSLLLKVADSGRTLIVQYSDLKSLVPTELQLGDVLLACMGDGRMWLQVTDLASPATTGTGRWRVKYEDVGPPQESGAGVYVSAYRKARPDASAVTADEIRWLNTHGGASDMVSAGMKKWGRHPPGLYLFPEGWVDIVPDDMTVTSISGSCHRVAELRAKRVWDDTREGVLAFGIDLDRQRPQRRHA